MRSTTARSLSVLLTAAVVSTLAGCKSSIYDAQAAFKQGDMAAAEKKITSYARANKRSEHRVIAHFELGSILFEAGRYEASAAAFQFAEDELLALETEKEYKVSEEIEAAIKNPAEVTYRGTPYERVMSATMLGLAYCMVGDFESARPSFRSADFWQDDGIRRRQAQIDKAQRDVAEEEKNAELVSTNESAAGSYSDSFFVGYETVSNAFADVVQGAFLLGQLQGSSDASDAAFLFGRASEIHPDNSYAAADAALAAEAGFTVPNRTYVLFATGFSPYMVEFPIVLPLPGVGLATAAFPILKTDESGYTSELTVDADGRAYTVEPIASMDRIVGANFNAELPLIVTRHTASILAKNGIAVGARATARQVGGVEGLFIQLTAWAYNIWQNKADIRSWQTLPKYYMYASFPTPESGVITIVAPPFGAESVEVAPTGVNMVYVRALRPNTPVTVAAFQVGTGGIDRFPQEEEPTEPPLEQPENDAPAGDTVAAAH